MAGIAGKMYLITMRVSTKLLSPHGCRFTTAFVTALMILSPNGSADQQEPQVQIEAKMVEVNDSHNRDLGTDWSHAGSDTGFGRMRGLEHVGQPGNTGQAENVFDFNPLHFPQTPSTQTDILQAPKVQSDGKINLEVKPHTASTHVRVKDGETAVLGGLIQETPEQNREKVPLLGKIPVLGRLFGGQPKQTEQKELLVFVTPTIVQDSTD